MYRTCSILRKSMKTRLKKYTSDAPKTIRQHAGCGLIKVQFGNNIKDNGPIKTAITATIPYDIF